MSFIWIFTVVNFIHRLELKLSIQHDKLCKENKLLQSSFHAWNVSHTLGFHLDSKSRYNLVTRTTRKKRSVAFTGSHCATRNYIRKYKGYVLSQLRYYLLALKRLWSIVGLLPYFTSCVLLKRNFPCLYWPFRITFGTELVFRFELNHETNFGCGFLSTKRRARTRHKKRGRSWNLIISFSRPEQQWKLSVGHREEKLSLTFRCQSKMETSNKPFPSCPKPLFESEVKCEVIDMKTFFTKKVLH